MIHLKPGVRINILSPQAVLGMQIVAGVFQQWRHELVITSICEGEHSLKSKHYIGCAFDVRYPIEAILQGIRPKMEVFEDCRKALGSDWDCVEEADHWHFEYDPKGQPI